MIKVTNDNIREIIRQRIKDDPSADLNDIDVSEVTDMSYLFAGVDFRGDISRWNTHNVLLMDHMFDCNKCFNGDISGWDTSSVMYMSYMFNLSVFDRDISNWNVSNVLDMFSMFSRCKFNKDISGWDMMMVTNIKGMFWGNKNFNQDISRWLLIDDVMFDDMFLYSIYDKALPISIDPMVAFNDDYELYVKRRLDKVIELL